MHPTSSWNGCLSIKYEEVYLKAYQNGTEARKGIGAYLAFYNQAAPSSPGLSVGQVFHGEPTTGVYWNIHKPYNRMKVYAPQRYGGVSYFSSHRCPDAT